MNFVDFLLEESPCDNTIALLTPEGNLSYHALRLQVAKVSGLLRERGLSPGQRVLLIGENSPFWVSSYLGIIKTGLVAVPISPSLDLADLESIVRNTSAAAVFMSRRAPARLARALKRIDVIDEQTLDRESGAGDFLSFADFNDRTALAALMFTSGSTGSPRGVMVTHRNLIANTTSILEYLQLHPDDRMMVVLPFFYCFGASLMHTHIRARGSLVLDNRFMFADRVLEFMQQTECTGFAGVPATYQILLRKSSFPKMRFPALRHLQQAGGKLTDSFLLELQRLLEGKRIFVMYGQTEATARISYLPPELLANKLGSIGRGIPGVTMLVQSADGTPVRPGEVGEIVAYGDNISPGYWNDADAGSSVFREGRLHTGDLARSDEDGYVYVVGRTRDFLKLGGYRVSAQQIESVLSQVPGVVELCVVAIPDELQGEAVKLFVAHLRGESALAEIETFCAERLPVHQRPKEVVFRPELPKNSSGKIDKCALQRGEIQ